MSEPRTDDPALVEALAGGDTEAARELYRRHCQPVLRFALAMTDSRAAAEDIVHDTFVELLQRPGNYDPERGSLRAFLYGVARHRIARAVRVGAQRSPGPAELEAATATPEDQTECLQELGRLRAAIRALPFVYREIIAWCDLEEVPYATVAQILRCPIGTVRSRRHRARALLAEELLSQRPGEAACDPEPPERDGRVQHDTSLGGVLGGGSR